MKRLTLSLLILSTACSSDGPPTGSDATIRAPEPGPFAASVIVSDPAASSPASSRVQGGSSGRSVTFVSLPPGSLPDDARVRVVNLRTHDSVVPSVVDGGFDPIAIPAGVGDTLDLVVTEGTRPSTHTRSVAPSARPPRVVRTNPPKGKTDVPLNFVIVVVISEPVDPASLSPNGIRLRRGTQSVPGSIALNPDGTVLSFIPTAPLQQSTSYDLEITRSLVDLSGTALDSATTVSFTTVAVTETQPVVEPRFASVGAGHGFSCGLTTEGEVYCWGYRWSDWIVGDCPEVADWDWFPCGEPVSAPEATSLYVRPVKLAGKFAVLSVGWRHACAITVEGAAYCWGYSAYAQLGNGDFALVGPLQPQPVAGDVVFRTISAGTSHTCGVAVDGAAYCWGLGIYGELGSGQLTGIGCGEGNETCNRPQRVLGGLSIASVSAGVSMTCALTLTGAAYCWGINAWGALGNGNLVGPDSCRAWFRECSKSPVAVAGGHRFTSIAALMYSACALRVDGAMLCWGVDTFGFGPTSDACDPWLVGECSPTPRMVADNLRFTRMSASVHRSCATTVAGAVLCWGWNTPIAPVSFYDAGFWGDFGVRSPVVTAGGTFAMLSTGPSSHSCGVTNDGQAYCWGDNSAGQLGDGTRTSSMVPVRVRVAYPP